MTSMRSEHGKRAEHVLQTSCTTLRSRPVWLRRGLRAAPILAPGVGVAGGIAAVGMGLARLLPVVGSPVLAIIFGIVIARVRHPAARLQPGIAFTSKRLLQTAVVVLGLGLSLDQVLTTGLRSLPVLLGTLLIALGTAWAAGRALGLGGALRTLIGVGTAICGASAIAATDAVIGADDAEVSYAIATIFTFNVVAVLLYPTFGHLLGLSQHSFGLWTGTAINDVSSVVAASAIYGHAAASYGVIVKLTRTLAIIPICLTLAAIRGYPHGQTTGAEAGGRLKLKGIVPVFILAFVAASLVNTLHLMPSSWHHELSDLATWMITAALAAIGLLTDVSHIRRAGMRPLALGAILWATVGLTSLGLQALTDTL